MSLANGLHLIRDHIESEVGETLEVVARAVTLEVELPDEVRIESLGAFPARSLHGRTLVDLGDLVSGQEVDVPLRRPTEPPGSSRMTEPTTGSRAIARSTAPWPASSRPGLAGSRWS